MTLKGCTKAELLWLIDWMCTHSMFWHDIEIERALNALELEREQKKLDEADRLNEESARLRQQAAELLTPYEGKQSYLKACENIIGLKRGILSDVEAVERTAKEISSSEGDYSLSIMDLQRMWYDALMETLRITNLWGQALGLCDAQAVDLEQLLSVSWGNGVLYDADKDWADTLSMVEAGLLKPELALAKKYDLPCETPEDLAAIREKYMPEMIQLTAQSGLR